MLTAVLLMMMPVPMPLQDAGAQAAQAEAAKAEDKGKKMVCRSEGETGSRVRRIRVCMTAAEWDALAHDSQRNLDRLRDSRRPRIQDPVARGGG